MTDPKTPEDFAREAAEAIGELVYLKKWDVEGGMEIVQRLVAEPAFRAGQEEMKRAATLAARSCSPGPRSSASDAMHKIRALPLSDAEPEGEADGE